LKPRFVIDEDGSLSLIPLPKVLMDEYSKMLKNPEKFLKYDYLIPGGPTGNQKAGFPYSLSILKALFYN